MDINLDVHFLYIDHIDGLIVHVIVKCLQNVIKTYQNDQIMSLIFHF